MIKTKRSVARNFTWLLAFAVMLFWAQTAHAHAEHGEATGFLRGFEHPWSGWDHIMAMVAVGLWGAQLGAPAIWLLPVAFPMVMAFGGFLGLMGLEVPAIVSEGGIALSALLLGIMVLGEVRSNKKGFLVFAAALVGVFGLFHGYAHGHELPRDQANLMGGLFYSIGFVVATGSLHALGIAIGLIHRWPAGKLALRGAGCVIALGGVYFLWEATHEESEAAPTSAPAAMMVIHSPVSFI
jgi:urease accessory protein